MIPDGNSAGSRRKPLAFAGGAVIGALGGLIGLGGAEFRLPLLIGAFRFGPLEAVILNKAMSLVVVASALPFRAQSVPFGAIAANWPVVVNLLAGSLIGAWIGAGWATRLSSETLYRIIAVLLVGIAAVLMFGHDTGAVHILLDGVTLAVAGIVAGFAIGVVASLLGVAGGELLIPTLIFLFGVDIKLAGSLSLAVSLPTMLVGVHPLQPRSELQRHRAESSIFVDHGGRFDSRNLHWRAAAWHRAERNIASDAGAHSCCFRCEGLAA